MSHLWQIFTLSTITTFHISTINSINQFSKTVYYNGLHAPINMSLSVFSSAMKKNEDFSLVLGLKGH